MEKYLYLTKHEWQNAWVSGGIIPINLASTYLSLGRDGIYTPDENLIHDSNIDLTNIPGFSLANCRNVSMSGCTYNGAPLASFKNASIYVEDGLILSFCNDKSADIAKRLGKVCCVKILDVNSLKSIIDTQLGVKGKIGECQYTTDHQRNHFLKSVEDSWQKEYRMFWPGKEMKHIILPVGIAEPVSL